MANTEELQFLETRKRLKDQIRKRNYSHHHHLSKSSDSDKSYGSFFGPSQPSIAPRVIQESKLFSLKTQIIPALRAVSADVIVSTMDQQNKVQRLRETRDYSFLSSDNNDNVILPITTPPPAQAQSVLPSTEQCAGDDDRKKRLQKLNDPKSKPKRPPVASSKPLPLTNKRVIEKAPSQVSLQHHCTEKRWPVVETVHPTKQVAGSNNSRGTLQRPKDAALRPKQAIPSISKPAETTNKRVRDNISSPVSDSQDHRLKKRRAAIKSQLSDEEDDDEGEKARLIIRRMFNTERFAGRDDRDIRMETSFRDIMKEEKRSERLGRKEDQEELRLLEEVARLQRMRTSAKKSNKISDIGLS